MEREGFARRAVTRLNVAESPFNLLFIVGKELKFLLLRVVRHVALWNAVVVRLANSV